ARLADVRRAQQHTAYLRDFDLATREWTDGYPGRAEDLLDRHHTYARRGWEWFHLKRRCHDEDRIFPGARCLAWSPDGRLLATALPGADLIIGEAPRSAWRDVQLLDPATGRLVRTLAGEDHVEQLLFSSDGQRLLVQQVAGRFAVWQVVEGKRLGSWI